MSNKLEASLAWEVGEYSNEESLLGIDRSQQKADVIALAWYGGVYRDVPRRLLVLRNNLIRKGKAQEWDANRIRNAMPHVATAKESCEAMVAWMHRVVPHQAHEARQPRGYNMDVLQDLADVTFDVVCRMGLREPTLRLGQIAEIKDTGDMLLRIISRRERGMEIVTSTTQIRLAGRRCVNASTGPVYRYAYLDSIVPGLHANGAVE